MASAEQKEQADTGTGGTPCRCLLLDFDGTLCDSETVWPQVEIDTYTKLLGTPWKGDKDRFTGLAFPDVYAVLVDEFGLKMPREVFMSEVAEKMADEVYARANMMPGAESFLRKVHAAKVPMAIATAAHRNWVDKVLIRHNLTDLFVGISSSESLGPGEGKPEPAVYLTAAALAKAAPGTCVAIEDSFAGVTAAKRAGIRCIAFMPPAGSSHHLSAQAAANIRKAADVVCATFAEVESALHNWGLRLPALPANENKKTGKDSGE